MKINIKTQVKTILADTLTPVSIFLKLRELYPNSLLLESSDYHGSENSFSFICLDPIAEFKVTDFRYVSTWPNGEKVHGEIAKPADFATAFNEFIHSFKVEKRNGYPVNGIFGYSTFDAVQYFETIKFKSPKKEEYTIPDVRYGFFRYIIAINHFQNLLYIIENNIDQQESEIPKIEILLNQLTTTTSAFKVFESESSNITDHEYMDMVTKGKKSCFRGDVFQIVLSRQFNQPFQGDDFNVYRALRSINPSPYLFYYDYGDYRIFGSSPEAQLKIKDNRGFINPIAGTFKRSGNDLQDKEMAEKLARDEKENAEHVMLVDLARNDLSRHGNDVQVDSYRDIQFYSHVIHMVSTVSGQLHPDSGSVDMMMATFPAGTLSGAPKYKAMQLIDEYENQSRGYYGGALGYIDFDGTFNHAIMIRTFLSKNNYLYYQAGAGIVAKSIEESELQEVNNKLGALKKAIEMAQNI
ncbi:MAG: anthranilate synthase component I family protein [Bacteroidetes bacterium]|jgi:anthranilate synthase component 1|nr:anthranilate synthase component I family protein [Bacteroidota bacterium]